MSQVIIYKNDEGGVSVVIPATDALALHGIEAIAVKDVPVGKRFKIINATDLPLDRDNRDAWSVDDADLTDGVGGVSNEFN